MFRRNRAKKSDTKPSDQEQIGRVDLQLGGVFVVRIFVWLVAKTAAEEVHSVDPSANTSVAAEYMAGI